MMGQQLFDRQSSLCRMRTKRKRGNVRVARRPMHREQRVAQRGQSQAVQQCGRQQLQAVVVGQSLQRLPDQFADARRP